jgi:hypothetical protein
MSTATPWDSRHGGADAERRVPEEDDPVTTGQSDPG